MSFIVYEDDALVVLDKPAGCSSEEGVPQRLREQWGKPDAYVGVIHRLDTGVSGLMVYAKTPQAAAFPGSAQPLRRNFGDTQRS